MQESVQIVQERVRREAEVVERMLGEVRRVIVGQKYLLERMAIGILARGHLLLEGVPGLAKTLAVRTLGSPRDSVTVASMRMFTPFDTYCGRSARGTGSLPASRGAGGAWGGRGVRSPASARGAGSGWCAGCPVAARGAGA